MQTKKVENFKNKFQEFLTSKSFKNSDLELIFYDERFSSFISKNILYSLEKDSKEQRKIKDSYEASIILQSYFDYLKNKNEENR